MQDLPRGTVTFLFTDLEGSTRLWQTYPREEMERAYARHDAILDEAAAAHNGFVFDRSGGDALKIAFHSADDALGAAIQAQVALIGERWPMKEPLLVRMALHMCQAYPESDGNAWDYRTPRLNRLGRLLAAGHGGQILLTSTVEGQVREELPIEVTLSYLGEHRLRDLQPDRVYQVVHPDLPRDFPPLRSAARFTHNLPYLPTTLIGRERETAEVRALLLGEGVRLVTLTGPGGTGKTRLAIHAAAGLLESFADGVFLIDLAALQDPNLVPSAIARTLGVREEPERSPVVSLMDWLREREVLIVLDTFEQVIGASRFVSQVLGTCPRLKLLIASRAALRIQAEHEYPVPPLAVPDANGPVETIGAAESVRLFVERAQAFQPGFAITTANAPTLARICASLDGLPLAIELAAARIKVFPPPTLLSGLERRLPLLTGGARDLPPRQRTLRDTIAWSYDLLDPAEQSLFRRLSLFAGGFTLDAAEAVCGTFEVQAPGSRLQALDGIEVLIDNSLLRQQEGADGPRYRMLDTIREYGWDRLEAAGELEADQDRHAAVFLDLAEQTESHLRGAEREGRLESLDREQDNLRAALGWLRDQGDAERGLRLASALWQWWWWRTSLTEGRRWLEEMLALPRAAAQKLLRARALTGLATLVETQGEYDTAEILFEQAELLWHEVGDRHGLASSLLFRWLVAFDREDYARMDELAVMSRATFEEVGDAWGIALSLAELGIGAMRQGDLANAEAWLHESRSRFAAIPDRWGIAVATGTLGNVAFGKSEFAVGMARLKESFDLFLQMGDGWGLATFMLAPARAASDLQQWERAACLMGAAAAFSDAIGAPLRVPFRQLFEANKAKARANLGDETFERVWAKGRAMTPKQAVDFIFAPPNAKEDGRRRAGGGWEIED